MQQAIEEAKKMIKWYGLNCVFHNNAREVLSRLIERLEKIPQKNSNIDISDEYYKNNPTSYWWVIWIINLPPTT